MQRWHFKHAIVLEEGWLRLTLGACTGFRRRSGLFHASLSATRRRRIVPFLTGERRAVIHIVHIERRFVISSRWRPETGFAARRIACFGVAAHNAHIVEIFRARATTAKPRQALEVRGRGQCQMGECTHKLETTTG